ncbi:serine/threonine protein kinase, CMGC family, CDC2/CDK subfamily [Cryomyces antarcticus]
MTGKSRWADDEEDAAAAAQRKLEKEEKKRAKAEKQRQLEEAEAQKRRLASADTASNRTEDTAYHPAKRRRLSADQVEGEVGAPRKLLRFQAPTWSPCRSIDDFDKLNHIEEGSYGFVSRAKDISTGEIVAIKHLKMDNPNEGFPVTALREIQTLMASDHQNIVHLREVVVGEELGNVFMVMDFLEHDLKTLQEDMAEPFLPSEIKTLLLQIGSAVEYLHDHWIIHRDLKTSNILLDNRGRIKLADFGLARYIGDPLPPNLTKLVVTLWYRAPELLLGTSTYDSAIDMWSIGCIFGELLTKEPLLQGKNEVDQLSKIFELCGIPTDATWPGFKRLPNAKSLRLPKASQQNTGAVIRAKFPFLTTTGTTLLTALLSLNPAKRPSATQMLAHGYFPEDPRPKNEKVFPTFPSKAGMERRRRRESPNAPKRGKGVAGGEAEAEVDFSGIFAGREMEEQGCGFQLKLI